MTSCPFENQHKKEKSENNNNGSDEGTTDNKMQCPICKSRMFKSGQLKMKNPRTNRYNMVTVYRCRMCGYQTIG